VQESRHENITARDKKVEEKQDKHKGFGKDGDWQASSANASKTRS
jgi:hypothetical protein